MVKRILVLTKDYFKLSSPNAMCMQGIIKEWINCNLEIDVISAENDTCISDAHNMYIKKPTIKFRQVQKLINYPLDSKQLVREYENTIEKCISEKFYDLIVAVVNPTESAQALLNIKKKYPKQKTCIYEIDPISNRYKVPKNLLEKCLTRKATYWSCSVYNGMDFIIHMVSHRHHFEKKDYLKFTDKTFYLDIPALRNVCENDMKDNSEDMSIVYAGAFYKDLRNPKRILEALKKLCEKYSIKIYIYTNEAMIHEIREMTEECRSNFYISSYIPEKELNEILLSASFLLSVGNKDSDFLPSKIFTYFCMNKPIIHYSFGSNDVALSYLQKYGKALCVSDQDSIETIAEEIEKFIQKKNSILYTKEELNEMFVENTPRYSAKKIIEYCEV